MTRRFLCINGLNSPFETGRVYVLQHESKDALYFEGVKGGWPKTMFVEVGPQ